MLRSVLFLALAAILAWPGLLLAQSEDGPPISITSPDTGTTFAYATIKSRSLVWNKNQGLLIAMVTFTDAQMNQGQSNDDAHEFRLPGVTFDAAKGIFYAKTAQGELIPVAKMKQQLFLKSVVALPNARVRIIYPRGNITVILEAIRPDDPAMHPASTDSDGTHSVDIKSAIQ